MNRQIRRALASEQRKAGVPTNHQGATMPPQAIQVVLDTTCTPPETKVFVSEGMDKFRAIGFLQMGIAQLQTGRADGLLKMPGQEPEPEAPKIQIGTDADMKQALAERDALVSANGQ